MNQTYISVASRHLYKSCMSLSFYHSAQRSRSLSPLPVACCTTACRDSLLKLPIASFVMEWYTKMTQRLVFFSEKGHESSLSFRAYCKRSSAAEKLCEIDRLTDFTRIYHHPTLLWIPLICFDNEDKEEHILPFAVLASLIDSSLV